ncbi:hypothetical protein AVDCRST_MAG84-2339 [uncultured Microcoleus sp.]|uniref:Uncharacterized protein n=1 Tax=uncultured Microcoleus sp. TaxID=259945 RepID=A0A6J4LSP8_9CYAN|nr:hypothetical protein AVDCRST_MAG84-2339 [uncultured Microcoleus sp.]
MKLKIKKLLVKVTWNPQKAVASPIWLAVR